MEGDYTEVSGVDQREELLHTYSTLSEGKSKKVGWSPLMGNPFFTTSSKLRDPTLGEYLGDR